MRFARNLSVVLLAICSWAGWTGWVGNAGAADPGTRKIIESVLNENTRAMAITPVFNQRVVHGLPDGWHAVAEKDERDTYRIEFVPEKQTAQVWRDMISLRGFRGMAKNPNATPRALLAQVAAELRTACGDKAITLSLSDIKVDGNDAHGAILGCSGPPADTAQATPTPATEAKRLGEVALYVAIRGSEDLFVLQRSVRAAEFSKADAPINTANAFRYFQELQPIKLCPRDSTELECVKRQPR
jgi:hypothetical protein